MKQIEKVTLSISILSLLVSIFSLIVLFSKL